MQSKKVFITSDTFVAFIDRAHPKHLHAGAFFRFFAEHTYLLYTTVTSVNDAYEQIYTHISPSLAKDFLKALSLGNITMVLPEEADIKLTYKTLLNSQNIELTLTQALTAVLCHNRNIPQICTFTYLHSLFGLQLFYLPI